MKLALDTEKGGENCHSGCNHRRRFRYGPILGTLKW